jgi:hypothetical protein
MRSAARNDDRHGCPSGTPTSGRVHQPTPLRVAEVPGYAVPLCAAAVWHGRMHVHLPGRGHVQTLGANVVTVRRSSRLRQSRFADSQAVDLRECGDRRRVVAPRRFLDRPEPGHYVAYVSFARSARLARHGAAVAGRAFAPTRYGPAAADGRGSRGPLAGRREWAGRVGSVFVA